MANWFVRINHRKDKAGALFTEQAERKLYYDLDTKKDVLAQIKKDYPTFVVMNIANSITLTNLLKIQGLIEKVNLLVLSIR